MNDTATLWDIRLSRNTDPDSSHLVVEEIRTSGLLAAQNAAVYRALREHPGCTSAELARYMGIERHIPGRRLWDLEQHGLATKGAMRECNVCKTRSGRGRLCVTWFVKDGRECKL